MQSCFSCTKCGADMKALNCGVVIDKCYEFNFHVLHPLLNGWRCPRYQRNNSAFMWRRPRKDGSTKD